MFTPLVKIYTAPSGHPIYSLDPKFLRILPDLKNMLGISYEIDPHNPRRAGIEILNNLWLGPVALIPQQNNPTQPRKPENFYFPPSHTNNGWKMAQELQDSPNKWRVLNVLNAENGATGPISNVMARVASVITLHKLPIQFPNPDPNAGFIVYSSEQRALVIVFRGTATGDVNDWATNFSGGFTKFPENLYISTRNTVSFWPDQTKYFWQNQSRHISLILHKCFLHTGCAAKYNSMKAQIIKIVNSVLKQDPYTEIYTIGHSMGAALAHVCALDLIGYNSLCAPEQNRIKVWAVAAPKIFSSHLASIYEEYLGNANKQYCNTIRQETQVDSVTRTAPWCSHVGILALSNFIANTMAELNRLVILARHVPLTENEIEKLHTKLLGIKSHPTLKLTLARTVSIKDDILDLSIPLTSSFVDLNLWTLVSITSHFGSVMNSASIGGGILNKNYITTNMEDLLKLGHQYEREIARF